MSNKQAVQRVFIGPSYKLSVLLENYFLCCPLDLLGIKPDFTETAGNFSELEGLTL